MLQFFPRQQQAGERHLFPCGAAKLPALPTPLWRHGESSPGCRLPSRLAQRVASALVPALALQKQLPAGFTESFSNFQVLQGQGCAGANQALEWCHWPSSGPGPGAALLSHRVGASPDACGAGQGQGGSLSAERHEESPGSSLSVGLGLLNHLVLDSQAEQDSRLALG